MKRRRSGIAPPSEAKVTRCAIYTRVSTDHGLEQDFNSLDAQREACAAFVKSQMHEGWTLISDHYDDGGFSGGTLERPALTRLLADIEARKIDTVVVYKVDRLTRSLTGFARLIELFEANGVSFVSVTQSFNTTTSMGRLTLNVLLSFAQFEREVAGERIRDKVAASKKKGIWVGGVVPLGYRLDGRKLIIDEAEAATVRMIFERYLQLGGLTPLLTELHQRGITTRRRTLSTGKTVGGIPLGRGALGYLLKNRMYVGELNHRDQSYPGEHQPIIDRQLFDAVQAKQIENRAVAQHKQAASEALLMGRIFDDRGNRMTPTHSRKNGARYRYYTSRALADGRKDEAGTVASVPAPDVEAVVLDAVRPFSPSIIEDDFSPSPDQGAAFAAAHQSETSAGSTGSSVSLSLPCSERELIAATVDRIVVMPRSIEVQLNESVAANRLEKVISVGWTKPASHRRRAVQGPQSVESQDRRTIGVDAQASLIDAIARARRWMDEISSGKVDSVGTISIREQRSERSIRMTLSLAFLAPDIVWAIVGGLVPRGMGLSRLVDLPIDWVKQREVVGPLATYVASSSS
jgi:DNA invertase Pin-like site-specific DNA recombinase